jgi:hypothetical protein
MAVWLKSVAVAWMLSLRECCCRVESQWWELSPLAAITSFRANKEKPATFLRFTIIFFE